MSKLFKLAAISALTLGLAGAGTTAAFASTPDPTPTGSVQTPQFGYNPHPYPVPAPRAQLWQFDFTGAQIDGLSLNDVRGVGAIPMSRWQERDLSPVTSQFFRGPNSVTLRHDRLPLPVFNLRTCTATFDQEGNFRIVAGTGTGANLRVVPGTDDFILRGLISFDQFNLRNHRGAVCPLRFTNPFILRSLVEHNNLSVVGQLPSLVDFDVQGNAQLVRVRPHLPVPYPTQTGPGHFFSPSGPSGPVNSNPDNQPTELPA